MIAVVEIGGKQYTVEQDMTIIVDRQAGDVQIRYQNLAVIAKSGN